MPGRHAAIHVVVALAILATASAADGSVFVGHSGWFWGSPLPQGNTLRAIEFSGSRGYAVGDFGTVMRTDDGGTTWSGLTTGTTSALRIVRVLTPDSFVVAGRCDLRRSDDGGRSFTSLPWTPGGGGCTPGLSSVAFPTAQIGYVLVASGELMRTIDGGRSWTRRTAIPGTKAANSGSRLRASDVFFSSADTGFVTTEAGLVYRTTDGGTSWTPVASAPQHLDSVFFASPQTGFAAGGASVLKTSDGGSTWTQQGLVTPPDSLDWIRCADTRKCIAATANGDRLLRTEDGGQTWTPISPSTRELFAAAYTGAGSLVAVGRGGATVTSPDGGHNFVTNSDVLDGTFSLLRAPSSHLAFAAGRAGAFARSVDGGKTWSARPPPGPGDVVDLSFPDDTTGYELARGNVLMRTDDGGATWRLLDIGTFLTAHALVAEDAEHPLLVMQRGLRVSSNGGLDFRRIRQADVASRVFTAAGAAGGKIYAFGAQALAVSGDSGATWRVRPPPVAGSAFKKVDFVNASVAYALTRDGRAWRTSDGAGSWHELPALGSEIGTDLSFGDPNEGYVAVPEFGKAAGGYLMRTSDGGVTWRPQLVDAKPIRAGGLVATDAERALSLAGTDHLLATDRGGDVGAPSALTLSVVRKRPGKPGVIAINGVLSPAEGGEHVLVSKRTGRGVHWLFRDVTVSSSGRFSVFTEVRHTTSFVAQWPGDDDHVGAGTAVLTVPVNRR